MKKFIILTFLVLLIMPLVLAVDVTVKTEANYYISISLLQTGETYNLIDSFHKTAGSNGEVKTNFSTSLSEVDVGVKVEYENRKISYERYGPFSTSSPIIINTINGEQSNSLTQTNLTSNMSITNSVNNSVNTTINSQLTTINKTENNSLNKTRELVNQDGQGTGQVTSNSLTLSKTVYYAIGGILIITILIFLAFRTLSRTGYKGPGEIKTKKYSELKKEKDTIERQMMDSQKKLKEAQGQVNRLKNEQKIKDLEQNIEYNKKEISRLKRDY